MNIAALFVRLQADISDLERGMKAAQRSLSATGQAMQDLGRSLRIGLTLPLGLLGALTVRSAANLDSLKRGLTAVAGSSAEAEAQLSRLVDVAKLPGLGFREAIQGSIRLQAAGFSASLAEDALRGFGNALAIVGSGKAELDQVTRALSQIASKGKISAEEINQLAEVVPQIRVVMKEAFGTANSELLQKAGIDAETFVRKVTDSLLKLEQATGGPANSFENLSDSVFRASAAIGEKLLPVVIPLVDGLAAAAEQIGQLDAGTVRLGIALAATAALIGPLIGAVLGLTRAYTTLKIAGAAAGLTLGIGSAVAVGIAALTALYFNNKLNALAAAAATDEYRHSLSDLSLEAAKVKLDENIAAGQTLRTAINWTPKEVTTQVPVGDFGQLTDVTTIDPEWTRLKAELDANGEEFRILTRRVGNLQLEAQHAADAAGGTAAVLGDATAAAKALQDRLSVAREKLKFLDELGQSARDAAKALDDAKLEAFADATKALKSAADSAREQLLGSKQSKLDALDIAQKQATIPGPGIGDKLAGLAQQVTGLSGSLGPLALAAIALKPVFDGFRESLGPVLGEITEPLREVGRIFGSILAPVLGVLVEPLRVISQIIGLLAEPLRIFALVTTQLLFPLQRLAPVLEIIGKAFSFVTSAIGYLIRGIGDILNKLPGSIGNPLKELGQSMIDNAEAFRKGERVFGQLTDTATELKETLSTGIPDGFRVLRIQLARFASMTPRALNGAAADLAGAGASSVTDNRTTTNNFYQQPGEDQESFARRIERVVDQKNRRDSLIYTGNQYAFRGAR